MIVGSFGQSLSPGNEQRSFWHSASADTPGSRNYCGVKSPAIDARLIWSSPPGSASLIRRCKALGQGTVVGLVCHPHWHASHPGGWPGQDEVGQPEKRRNYGADT